jgi:DEAD/DEAH box helicase domain-containing protein
MYHMSSPNDFMDLLRRYDALRDGSDTREPDYIKVQTVPGEKPVFGPPDYISNLPAWLQSALAEQGISHLYKHQVEAIESINSGENVVIEAPTASGKTLSFNLPLLQMLASKPRSHAMMLHPMKALSNDQRRQFLSIAELVNGGITRDIDSWTFDGDTAREHRQLLKKAPPAVIFTNPEMLHLSFLGWSNQWSKYLKNLDMIIIDEIHEYRGYFGSHMAVLLRRFLAKLSQLGANPQIVMATATCANALEHAERLTGQKFKLVKAGTGMKPSRHFAFIEPHIPDYQYTQIFKLRLARASLAALSQGMSSIVFCPTRRFGEEVSFIAKKEAESLGLNPKEVVSYRSGYTSDQRRQIEDGLRNGDIKAVFCTNALEIGVDIGRLDVCILAGFPDSVLSAWQRIGRAGRTWKKDSFVLFYAFNNPFDRFYARNLQTFLDRPLDEVVVGLDNPEILKKHMPFAMAEVGPTVGAEERRILGKQFCDYMDESSRGRRPVGVKPNYMGLDLRGSSGQVYTLLDNGKEIGTISDTHKFREAYIGAIYSHCGKKYRVTAHGADEIYLENAEPSLLTEGTFYTTTQVNKITSGFSWSQKLAGYYGNLITIENFAGFREIHWSTGTIQREVPSQDARTSLVRGFWLETSGLDQFEDVDGSSVVLDSLEKLFAVGAPFVLPCDRHDIGTYSTMMHQQSPSVFLYETVPGGIGLAERLLESWPEVVRTAMQVLVRCDCKTGCPSCIPLSRKANGASAASKADILRVASRLLEIAAAPPDEVYDPETHMWEPVNE